MRPSGLELDDNHQSVASNIKNPMLKFLAISSLFFVACAADNQPSEMLQSILTQAQFDKGEQLFLQNCTSCHNKNMVDKSTAPALAGVTKRRTKEWLYLKTRSSTNLLAQKDSTALKLSRSYGASMMTDFEHLDSQMIADIYVYVEAIAAENSKPNVKIRPIQYPK